jgi:nucleoid-associated protein YgaU
MFSLVACSGSKSANNAEESEVGTEISEGEEFSDDFEDDLGMEDFEEESEEDVVGLEEEVSGEPNEEAVDSEMAEETADETMTEMKEEVAQSAPVQIDNSEMGWHTVARGETLMLISFKIYGDYTKWRDLARLNRATLGKGFSVSAGMKLQYTAPDQKFVWNPDGNPYLIRVGDTLGTISKETYGTDTYWSVNWKNNTPLIQNPNKIFAGFTIYTPIIKARDVANE